MTTAVLTGLAAICVAGVGFLGVITIMQPWTATDRPDLIGFSMALIGGASYGIGWTYNRRFLSGVDLGGLSQPAATLTSGLVLMVPPQGGQDQIGKQQVAGERSCKNDPPPSPGRDMSHLWHQLDCSRCTLRGVTL